MATNGAKLECDTPDIAEDTQGIRPPAVDSDLGDQVEAAREVMRENREVLRVSAGLPAFRYYAILISAYRC